jgi:hypothetical protein
MKCVSRKAVIACLVPLLASAGCSAPTQEEAVATESDAADPAAGEWVVLFDGQDLSRWRGYQRADTPAGWQVDDGTLAFVPGVDGGDLVTREQYGDFDLELEWKVSEGGNSGIMYRVSEELQYPWHTGPEMQILDDERHRDGLIPSHRAGALYDLIVPPSDIARPVGEWNEVRIVLRGNHLQQWLNGHSTADVEIGSEEWNRLVAASKFNDMPGFASMPSGHVVLQDHGDPVWFRNVRIRPLGGER